MADQQAIAEWQDRLSDTFRGPTGTVGERLSPILKAEDAYFPVAIQNTHGFTTMMDCFQDFYAQTFDEMITHARVKNVNVCAILIASFHRLRYALQGFYRGYPYDGAASIRALFENGFFLGAVLNGFVKHDDLFSFVNGLDVKSEEFEDLQRIERRHLSQLERRIKEQMRGSASGLSEAEREGVDQILQTLHLHVHRAKSSIITITQELVQNGIMPSLSPHFDQSKASTFSIPTVYATWLLHRVLPFVTHPNDFSNDWKAKFSILDESFQFYVRPTQGEGHGAFCRMIELRFSFDVDAAWANVEVEPLRRSSEAGNR